MKSHQNPILVITLGLLIPAFSCAETPSREHSLIFNFETFLDHLEEPRLRDRCSGSTDTIRLVANPTFSNAWSVRLTFSVGEVRLYVSETALSGAPAKSVRNVDENSWRKLVDLWEVSKIFTLSTTSDTWIPDATIATLESCFGGKYDLVQRQFGHPEAKDVVDFLSTFRTVRQESTNNALHLPPESYLSRLLQPLSLLLSQQPRQILGCKLA